MLNILGVAGLLAGLDYIEQRGLEAIRNHEMALYRRLASGMSTIEGITLYCKDPVQRHLPVLSFNVKGIHPDVVGRALGQRQIACGVGLHRSALTHRFIGTDPKGTVRLSLGPFNTAEHVDVVVEALAEIAGSLHSTGPQDQSAEVSG